MAGIVEWRCTFCGAGLDPQFMTGDPGRACSVCHRIGCARCVKGGRRLFRKAEPAVCRECASREAAAVGPVGAGPE